VTGLEFRDVYVEYRSEAGRIVGAVVGVSLHVEHGQVVGLVGESGCGKSTLARAATGVVPIRSGEVLFEGQPVTHLSWRPRPAHEVRLQMIFQDSYGSLNPRRRVGTQVEQALELAGRVTASGRARRARDLLEQVGLAPGVDAVYPHQLSGGQRQRVCIARALAAEPSVIVADEPISSLDASAQAQIANLLLRLARDLDVGLLFISHDLGIVRHIADVVYVMYLGQIVELGTASEVWSEPLHPYSRALIDAVPIVDGAGALPISLPGEVPDPSNPPRGCRFHPRCPVAMDRCSSEPPPRFTVRRGREAACWLAQTNAGVVSALDRRQGEVAG
jgi:oligopeptide/dipeptide ABC transporter ATP-binding protein